MRIPFLLVREFLAIHCSLLFPSPEPQFGSAQRLRRLESLLPPTHSVIPQWQSIVNIILKEISNPTPKFLNKQQIRNLETKTTQPKNNTTNKIPQHKGISKN